MSIKPSDIHDSVILYSALNWGYGHVTRSISIIDQLLLRENRIIICASEEQQTVFKHYFEGEKNIHFDLLNGYPFNFKGSGNFELDILKNTFQLYKFFKFERKWVDRKIVEHHANYVISDHRYGFYSHRKYSIFITHQYQLPANNFFNFLHKLLFKQFNSVWLIDETPLKLAGKLSDSGKDKRAVHIGLQSRFRRFNENELSDSFNNVLIVNGPPSYWPQLINLYSTEIKQGEISVIIGNTEVLKMIPVEFKGQFLSNERWLEIDKVIRKAQNIYSYMGYSTLMDLKVLGISSRNLRPCSGQKEQEYLFNLHKKSPTK
jgi:hypothetical protein